MDHHEMNARPHPFNAAARRAHFQEKLAARFGRPQAMPTTSALPDFSQIILGHDAGKRLIMLPEQPRLEHMHALGATGSGKSNYLLNCALQDIKRGRGVALLDPHGGHPVSGINMTLRFLRENNFPLQKVHVISPNLAPIVGLDPLAPLPETDPSVIADNVAAAFESTWGEDTTEKPTTRRVLRVIFSALSHCRMALADAYDAIDPQDRRGVRAYLIEHVADEHVGDELRRMDELARNPRTIREYEAEALGPRNRLEEFLANPNTHLMFSMKADYRERPAKTIDLLSILDRGDILLVDLQPGPRVSRAATDMLGKLILCYLFLLMNYRSHYEPFFVYVDEVQRFVTDDLKHLLDEARKYGISLTLAHRYLAELGKPGEPVYDAVLNSTEVKAVFRMQDGEEAERIARNILPLNLALPILESTRPVVVGHSIEWLHNETSSASTSTTKSIGSVSARSVSQGVTEMQAWGHARSRSESTGRASGMAEGTAHGWQSATNATQSHSDNLSYSYDPATQTFITTPLLGINIGQGDSTATAQLDGRSLQTSRVASNVDSRAVGESFSDIKSGALAHSRAVSDMLGETKGLAVQHGESKGRGRGQAVIPQYTNLPTTFDTSKENALYRAAEQIRSLKTGEAIVRFRNSVAVVAVPLAQRTKAHGP